MLDIYILFKYRLGFSPQLMNSPEVIYDPQLYYLHLIRKTRNEIYHGVNRGDPSYICIFKYTNDQLKSP